MYSAFAYWSFSCKIYRLAGETGRLCEPEATPFFKSVLARFDEFKRIFSERFQ